MDEIKNYFENSGIPFDLIIISSKRFKSNIYKESFKNLPIKFYIDNTEPVTMHEVTHIPLDTLEEKEFFYLYYKRDGDKKINIDEFSKALKRASIL